jgi:hypothetical protein
MFKIGQSAAKLLIIKKNVQRLSHNGSRIQVYPKRRALDEIFNDDIVSSSI